MFDEDDDDHEEIEEGIVLRGGFVDVGASSSVVPPMESSYHMLAGGVRESDQLPGGSAFAGSADSTRDAPQLLAGSVSAGSADGPLAAAGLRPEDVIAIQIADAAQFRPPQSSFSAQQVFLVCSSEGLLTPQPW